MAHVLAAIAVLAGTPFAALPLGTTAAAGIIAATAGTPQPDTILLPLGSSPLAVHSASLTEPSTPVIRLQGGAGPRNVPVAYLVDCGATALFMDTALARRLGLVPRPSGRTIRLADGSIKGAAGTVRVTCTVQTTGGAELTFEAEFCVTELQGHEAILGMPWLQHFNPTIDWRTRAFTVAQPSGPLTLRCVQASSDDRREPELKAVKLVTTPRAVAATRSQWVKMLRKGQLDLNSLELIRIKLAPGDRPAARPAELAAATEGPPRDPALSALLSEFSDVLPDKLPPMDPSLPSPGGIVHRIELEPGTKPHAAPLRRYSPIEDEEIQRAVTQQLEQNHIEESTSPWGAMVLLAKKKDGTLRFCVDYRVLNNGTVKNRYALPLADDCFDRAQGANWFSKLDLHSGFWQIRLDPASAALTAFRTKFGHYQYTVLPMGLCNAPGTFMHVMNSVFRAQLNRFMLVFLDDIFIFSRTKAEHLAHLREVLGVLRANRLFLKPSKCEWMKEEVEFLGHRVGRAGLQVDPHKVDAVRQWPAPRDVSQLRSFLGLAGYYRRFLEGYSQVALPLTELTKDEVPWRWEAAEIAAFERLKAMLSGAPALQLADPKLPYVIHCDASGFAVGACLMQDHGSGLQPVSYISAKMKPAETRYAPHEQELLALVYACRMWRHYLHNGQKFTVMTDHQSLRYLQTQPILSSRQARWKDLLAEFDFDIKYIEGPKNVVADPLSRRWDHKQTELGDRVRDANTVGKQEFLASIVLAERDMVPLAAQPCAGRPYALNAAALRGRRARGAQPSGHAPDAAAVAAQRVANRAAATQVVPLALDRPAPKAGGAIVMPTQRCTADTKGGKHCGARTKRGQYCFAHRRQLHGTRIKAATVHAHGLGLFTTGQTPGGTFVGEYSGDYVPGREAEGPYLLNLRIRGGGAIDAARTNTGDGRWVNATRGVKTPDGRPMRPNCIFVTQPGTRTARLKTTRDLPPGTELYASYGAAYWRLIDAARRAAARKVAPIEQLQAVSELSAATMVFGGFELIAQAREAAQADGAYAAQLASPSPGLTARDGLLWRDGRLVVPNDIGLRTRLLSEMHDTPTGGHFGRDKTQAAVAARFHWPGMAGDAAAFVSGCDMCQRIKHSKQRKPGLLMPLPVPEDIDSHWTMDFMTALPLTDDGHTAIQGHFSRGGSIKRLAACDDKVDAGRAADYFLDCVVRHHGVPASIVSDRGPQFVSHVWEALWARLGTRLDRSTGYHAETDGHSERGQQTMTTWLRAFCTEFPRTWDRLLPLAELALNCMPQAGSGVSPYELLYGRNPALSVDRALDPNPPPSANADEVALQLAAVPAAEARWKEMSAAWTLVRGKLLEAQQRMARNADRHRRDVHHAVGDMVLLSTEHLRINDPQHNAKLAHLFCGPFPVVRVVNANAYEIGLPAHMHIHAVVNITHLRAYRDGRVAFPDRPAPPGLDRPPPDAIDANGQPEYVVDRVLAQKGSGQRVQYLVLWKGYPYAEATWELSSALAGAPAALKEFRELHRAAGPNRPGARRRR
jgi:hypothetical protein